ncbi:MAG: tryptophan synthase subunit alpha [Planctomycetaceae bacterium]|nr:tryptophan synthase subunit alpha [Planctomycetaceae bacterium]
MSRLTETFIRVRNENRPAVIGYLTAGDPDEKRSEEIIGSVCRSGLDVLELGIPFSDPTADGPVIQRASQRAIKSGMTLEKGLAMVARLRQRLDLPIILFSYYNPIFVFGTKRFVREAESAGADGVLVVDLPHELSDEIMQYVPQSGKSQSGQFHFIRLIAPTTGADRRSDILRRADGFVYIVSRRGVTGSGSIDWDSLAASVNEMRSGTAVPLCVGFGIRSPEDAHKIAAFADGIIIGSAFEQRIEDDPNTAADSAAVFLREIRRVITS